MEGPVIEVRALTKRFREIVAVNEISFSVPPGNITALLGSNGAGKTTTLSLLLGLLIPTSGEIRVLGVDIRRDRYRALPRMNFTSPYVDLPHRLTAEENLRVYAHLYGIRNASARIRRLASELEFEPMLRRPYGQLSAGQKTRVALAKSLLNEPELLLMDEPTASLDPDMADYVRSYLTAYQRRSGASILMASHNMAEVERMCTDVIILREGRIVTRGNPAALRAQHDRATLEEVFIDIARNAEGHSRRQAPS